MKSFETLSHLTFESHSCKEIAFELLSANEAIIRHIDVLICLESYAEQFERNKRNQLQSDAWTRTGNQCLSVIAKKILWFKQRQAWVIWRLENTMILSCNHSYSTALIFEIHHTSTPYKKSKSSHSMHIIVNRSDLWVLSRKNGHFLSSFSKSTLEVTLSLRFQFLHQ